MKISIVVPVQHPSVVSPFAPEEGLDRNLGVVANAGYDGAELGITDPSLVDPGVIREILGRHRLSLSALTTGQAFGLEGISLTDPNEGIRERAIERLSAHVKLARALGAVVIVGLLRGTRKGMDAVELLVESLRVCADVDDHVRLALEPLNRYEAGIINTVDEALDVIRRVDRDNLGILFDTFHANIEEASIERSIEKARDRIFHVHVADSNRWAPGHGHLDFSSIVRNLAAVGYSGFFSLESLTRPHREACLAKTVTFMRVLEAK